MKSMILSISIVSFNTCEILRKCLEAVENQISDLQYEVIVVDNASSDGSQEMVQRCFPLVRLIPNTENQGFARANNQAIRQSQGDYIMLLNSDAFVMEGAVEGLLDVMNSSPDIGIAGADLVYPDGRAQVRHGPLPTLFSEIRSLYGLDKSSGAENIKSSGKVLSTGVVSGACLMVRRKMLDEIGLLDENIFMFSEEIDLCRRAHEAGYRVVQVPSARVVHCEGGSTGHDERRLLLLYKGKLYYFRKHSGRLAAALLLAAMWTGTLGKLLVYGALRILSHGRVRKEVVWLGVAKGLAGLKGA
jgi:GT2 family glycosyltransferase